MGILEQRAPAAPRPISSPYFAAKAAMDSLAVSYAGELSRWGIETSIIVPGAFTKGTNHFAHSGAPADTARVEEYNAGPYAGLADVALKGLAQLEPADADAATVAEAIVRIVDAPFGKRPFRVHVDPSEDGAEIVNGVGDRVRAQLLERIGLERYSSPARECINDRHASKRRLPQCWRRLYCLAQTELALLVSAAGSNFALWRSSSRCAANPQAWLIAASSAHAPQDPIHIAAGEIVARAGGVDRCQ